MAFSGFGPQALPFFKALAFHQTKQWFDENRAIYETEVKGPLGDLVEALAEKLSAAGIPLKGDRKTSIFRLNRDIRFSKDKRPYKTHAGAVLSRTGTRGEFSGMFYIHIDPEGCFAAGGFYQPEPEKLSRLRRAIVRAPKVYAAIVADLEKAGLPLSYEEKLTRLPRGFEDTGDPALAEALKRKSHVCSRPIAEASLAEPALVEELYASVQAALPLLEWGWAALADAR